MLIAEELVLLLVKDSCGRHPKRKGALGAFAGAVLVELALHGRLDVEEDGLRPRLFIADSTPVGHALLDDALARAAEVEGSTIEQVLNLIAVGLWARVLDALTEQGIMAKTSHKVFGLRAAVKWQLESPARREERRTRLGGVLADDVAPDKRSGALIVLLHALNAIGEVVDEPDKDRAGTRAADIADGGWPVDDVTEAVLETVWRVVHSGVGTGAY